MRTMVSMGFALVFSAALANAQANVPTSAQASAPAAATSQAGSVAPADVDPILDALDKRGKELSDFTADVKITDTDLANGTDTTLSGKMRMQRLGSGDARLRVTFNRKVHNDTPTKIHQEYVLANGMLIDRDYEQTKETRWQVLKPGQKMNLLKLGEGPFPLPLGQDKADVHKLFTVAIIPPAKDDPAGTEHVQLKPKPGTHFETKFATIDFWVDPKSSMPVQILTQDPNGTTTRQTNLSNIQIDTKLTDKDFVLEPIDEQKWQIAQEAYND